MKHQHIKLLSVILVFSLISCETIDEIVPTQNCEKGIQTHPYAVRYQKMANALLENGLVGASITIITPDGTWSSGIGMADIKNNVIMTPCHTLRIGSVSKIFAATAILKLQEQGKLDINEKASNYLPKEFASKIANADKASIKQLLNHTSGIVEYSNFSNILQIINLSIKKASAEENLRSIFGKQADFEVGTSDNYSNSNFLLLALIIEKVSGKEAYKYIIDELLIPNGLGDITASSVLPNSLTRAYFDQYDNGKIIDRTEIDNNAVGGANMTDGGMISNSYDLAIFHEKLMKGDILSTSSLQVLNEFRVITQDLGDLDFIKGYSLGMMKLETNHGTAIGHFGTVQSFNGMVFYFPEQKVTFSLIRNSESTKLKKFIESKAFFDYLFQD
jgi:D-alanyl-D-alanine carboxypeptidase